MKPNISIHIVTFNNGDEIIECIKSVLLQEGEFKKEIYIIDNSSSHSKTIELIKANFPQISVIKNRCNLGYSGGHNLGIRKIERSNFVLTLNPDVKLQKDYISVILDEFEKNKFVGMASGILLRSDEITIDSAGISIRKNRRPFDSRQNQPIFSSNLAIKGNFGPCGAAAIYRREFIEDLMVGGEFFDEDFFIYKEDVDICWRGQLLGWTSLFVPTAVAIHERGWKQEVRQKISRFVRFHSFKNRYLLILKNDDWINILYHLPWILLTEIFFLIYIILKEPFLFKSWYRVMKLIPTMLRKRRFIMSKRKITPKQMRKWFV